MNERKVTLTAHLVNGRKQDDDSIWKILDRRYKVKVDGDLQLSEFKNRELVDGFPVIEIHDLCNPTRVRTYFEAFVKSYVFENREYPQQFRLELSLKF